MYVLNAALFAPAWVKTKLRQIRASWLNFHCDVVLRSKSSSAHKAAMKVTILMVSAPSACMQSSSQTTQKTAEVNVEKFPFTICQSFLEKLISKVEAPYRFSTTISRSTRKWMEVKLPQKLKRVNWLYDDLKRDKTAPFLHDGCTYTGFSWAL